MTPFALLMLLPFASAQDASSAEPVPQIAPRGDSIQLTLVLDDRRATRVRQPVLVVEQEGAVPVPLSDDGSAPADVPGDHIWVAFTEVRKVETLSFGILEGEQRLGSFNVFLPNADNASFTLRSRQGTPALVIDVAAEVPRIVTAPEVPIKEVPVMEAPIVEVPVMEAPTAAVSTPSVDAPLVIVAAPASFTDEEDPESYPEDTIVVNVALDDREAQRLVAPLVLGDQEGMEPVAATDDGAVVGDVPEDGIYFAQIVASRAQYMGVTVMDGASSLGVLTVFLPTAGKAIVSLKTREGVPALAFNSDAAPGGGAVPMSATGSGQYYAARRGGCDQFSAVLWVTIGFFGLVFAYLRAVVRQTWQEEVRPFLRKVEQYIDRD